MTVFVVLLLTHSYIKSRKKVWLVDLLLWHNKSAKIHGFLFFLVLNGKSSSMIVIYFKRSNETIFKTKIMLCLTVLDEVQLTCLWNVCLLITIQKTRLNVNMLFLQWSWILFLSKVMKLAFLSNLPTHKWTLDNYSDHELSFWPLTLP